MDAGHKIVALENAIVRLSWMEAIGSKAISDSILRYKKITLQRLEYDISIFDSGRYGICTKCSREISFAGLRAIPYVTLCINCAQKSEPL